ncbi:MAG: CHASE2 domain-containing protein [Cellvibrionales bacterium]|nr:CHASE2 domain-containing protein [Cellvibrionales bacterium]
MRSSKKSSPIVTIAIASIIAALASVFNWFSSIDTAYYDFILKKNLLDYPDDIIIVAIDEASIERLGAWPWDRSYHAELLSWIKKADAIVFDLIFAEPQQESLAETEQALTSDQQFAKALRLSKNVILPVFIEELRSRGELREVMPISLYSDAAAGLGHAHVDYSYNGVARGLYLREGLGRPYWSHLSLVLTDMLGETPEKLSGKRSNITETTSPFVIYRDYYNSLRFVGPSRTIYRVSYIDVLDGLVEPEHWQGKRVFIGATAKGLGDDVPTPLGALPGVEFNVNAYQSLRLNASISEVNLFLHAAISAAIVACLAFLFSRLTPARFLIMTFIAIVGLSGLTVVNLLLLDFWFSPVASILAILVFYPLWSWRRIEIALKFLQKELSVLRQSSPIIAFDLQELKVCLKKLTDIGVINDWSLKEQAMDSNNAWPKVSYFNGGVMTDFHYQSQSFRLKIDGGEKDDQCISIMSAILSDLSLKEVLPVDSYELVEKTVEEIYSIKNVAKKAQLRMNKSMAELQDAVMVADAAGKIIFTNENFRSLFFDSFLGRSVIDLQDSISAYAWLGILRILMHDQERVYQEIQTTGKRCLLCQAAIIVDQQVANDTLVFVFTDVTQLRDLERGKNEALAFLSHDMRSPIVSLISLIESYRINNADMNDTKVEFMEQIEYFARKNLKYSEDFLQLSRAENISRDVFQLVDMHGVIDGAYSQVYGFSSYKNVDVIIDRTDEDCWVSGDVHLIERAVTNILYNAVQHTPSGNKVTIRLYAQQGIHVVVSDTGVGIANELIPHLFEPYFRARKKQQDQSDYNRSQVGVFQNDLPQEAPPEISTATHGAKSYGLGLSFVHTVVERHGGSIHVESVLDKGTSFLLKFPALTVD